MSPENFREVRITPIVVEASVTHLGQERQGSVDSSALPLCIITR